MPDATERETSVVWSDADGGIATDRARWLDTTWLRHRNTVEAVHPLLVRLQEARGVGFMTCGRMLDAKDPAGLVESWLLGARTPGPLGRTRGLGLSARLCAWRKGDETCERPVRAVNATLCEAHARASRRKSTREAVRRSVVSKVAPC